MPSKTAVIWLFNDTWCCKGFKCLRQRRIMRGECWCQTFAMPNHGPDTASTDGIGIDITDTKSYQIAKFNIS